MTNGKLLLKGSEEISSKLVNIGSKELSLSKIFSDKNFISLFSGVLESIGEDFKDVEDVIAGLIALIIKLIYSIYKQYFYVAIIITEYILNNYDTFKVLDIIKILHKDKNIKKLFLKYYVWVIYQNVDELGKYLEDKDNINKILDLLLQILPFLV